MLKNKKIAIGIVSIVFIVLVVLLRKSQYKCSDGKCYNVDRDNSDKSYEMLRDVEKDMKEILLKLSRDPRCPGSIKERIPYCLNNSTLSENIYGIMGETSFTVNKKDVYLCLKGDDGVYYEKNLIMMVAVHEYAHILCNSQDHTPEFHSINKFVLGKAVLWGYYKPIDFSSKPRDYCGLVLKHNSI